MQRVCVIGVTGSGKTTLAKRLAGQLHLDYVEMDSLYWNPHWTPVDPEIFRSRIAGVATGDAWVTDGTTRERATSSGREPTRLCGWTCPSI